MILEACVETLEEAILAEKSGANRIELCGDLSVGGITPSEELTIACLSKLQIPIMVMVRPRGGNFVYNANEMEEMKEAIRRFKSIGVAGVVFGVLDDSNQIDGSKTQELAALSAPLQVTFHKAIDETPNLVESVNMLSNIGGIQRVLTSGGKPTALEGADSIRQMMEAAKGKIAMIAAGKITHQNIHLLHELIGTTEYHGKRIVF